MKNLETKHEAETDAAVEQVVETVAETQPEPAVDTAAPTGLQQLAATDLLELISAAEERGYKRGVNVGARARLDSVRSVWEAPAMNECETTDAGEEILKCVRPSIWD